jgi:hypothetical protein
VGHNFIEDLLVCRSGPATKVRVTTHHDKFTISAETQVRPPVKAPRDVSQFSFAHLPHINVFVLYFADLRAQQSREDFNES